MNDAARTGITIFTGRFGSGKTETAISYALTLARDPELKAHGIASDCEPSSNMQPSPAKRLLLIDLDVVTPYFRSRETAELMQDGGVEVIAPAAVGQHLDTPAITPQILGAIQQPARPVVLDVGGDRQGARALGQFSAAIRKRGYSMHFVVNPYRPFTDKLEGLAQSIAEIEASARLKVTSLVSNPNLIGETTAQLITDGHARLEAFAGALGLPISFICIERDRAAEFSANHFAQPVLIIDRFFVMSWE
jgi:hypothetical protein